MSSSTLQLRLRLGLLLYLAVFRTWGWGGVEVEALGVNWGTAASHPLPPPKVVELLKLNNITKIRLFDADPLVLQALSGSKISVTLGVPNYQLKSFNSSLKAAEAWVHDNVTRYFSSGNSVRIEYIAVGDEPFRQSYGEQFHPFVLGAVTNIQLALVKAKLENNVKVVVPCSPDAFLSEPSKGHFRQDIDETIIEILTFLTKHLSPSSWLYLPFLDCNRTRIFPLILPSSEKLHILEMTATVYTETQF